MSASHDRPAGEYFLLTLLELGEAQSPSELLLAAWRSHPHVFGLEGDPTRYPDARHLNALACVREEWLRHEGGRYALTENGRGAARALRDGLPLPKPLNLTGDELLEQLMREAPKQEYHPWEECRDRLRDGAALTEAGRWGLRWRAGTGCVQRSLNSRSA